MKKGSAKAVPAGKRTAAEKLQYVKKNWQLYVFFLLPALLLTIIFKYVPMGGVLIAFEDYNVIDGVFGSKWVGLEYFRRFLASPDFMNYLVNTLKLSIYGLLWGFPIPIILALLLNQIRRAGIKKKIQLLIYAPNFISVLVTLLAAYPMSKKEFVGRNFFNVIFLITMFFGGGMIPTFILINQLHLVNTIWAILLPGAFNVWNMILARTYYQSIPKELREASAIDGATEIEHFFKIMMPVCKPIIAVLALWSFVGMWNSYFDAMIYLNDAKLQPLQLVLRSILVQNTPQPGMIADIQSTAQMAKVAELLKYATIIVSSLPLLIMYPFFQKYFDQGIMVGSVKG